MNIRSLIYGVLGGLMIPAAAAQAHAFWHIQGQQIIDSSGRSIMMRGINVGNWLLWEGWMLDAGGARGTETAMLDRLADVLSPREAGDFMERYQEDYITENDVAAMKQAGFNVIRVPVDWRALVSLPGCIACDGRGFEHLDHLILWAERHGIHVIIDMHAVPGGQSRFLTADPPPGGPEYWKDPADQQMLAALWSAVAARYASSATVAGYDLINEPNAPSGEALIKAYRTLIAAIRSVDPNHIIWLEGNRFAMDLSVFQQAMGPNIGYSSHVYIIGRDRRQEKLAAASALAARLDAPVWIGEFGQSSYDITHSTVEMMAVTPGLAGWAYWTWKRAASDDPAPCPLDLPKAWTAIAPWVGETSGTAQPAPPEAIEGTTALLRYIDSERCVPDARLIQALQP